MKTKRPVGIFSAIKDRADALKIAKDAGVTFIIVGVLSGVIGALYLPTMLIDAVLFVVFGFLLHRLQSRAVSLILLLLATIGVVTTVLNRIDGAGQGGTNIFLAIILLIAGMRGVEAAFKLHGRFKEKPAD